MHATVLLTIIANNKLTDEEIHHHECTEIITYTYLCATYFIFLCTICKAFCVAPTATHNKCQLYLVTLLVFVVVVVFSTNILQ